MEFLVSKRCRLASSSLSLGTSLSMAGLFLCCAFGGRNLHYLQICVYTEFNHRSHKMSCLVKLGGVVWQECECWCILLAYQNSGRHTVYTLKFHGDSFLFVKRLPPPPPLPPRLSAWHHICLLTIVMAQGKQCDGCKAMEEMEKLK